jgi:hypothetical protein
VNTSTPKLNPRPKVWYVKWLFASYASGFALTLLICTLALPFAGPKLFLLITEPAGTAAVFVLMALSAPFLYRHLK